jgi:hypothetical protein
MLPHTIAKAMIYRSDRWVLSSIESHIIMFFRGLARISDIFVFETAIWVCHMTDTHTKHYRVKPSACCNRKLWLKPAPLLLQYSRVVAEVTGIHKMPILKCHKKPNSTLFHHKQEQVCSSSELNAKVVPRPWPQGGRTRSVQYTVAWCYI